jgi:hypothetical protein
MDINIEPVYVKGSDITEYLSKLNTYLRFSTNREYEIILDFLNNVYQLNYKSITQYKTLSNNELTIRQIEYIDNAKDNLEKIFCIKIDKPYSIYKILKKLFLKINYSIVKTTKNNVIIYNISNKPSKK